MAHTSILIVEDEKIVAKDIQNSLSKLGYKITDVVSSGEEAVESARDKKPDLALVDIMLKGDMDGIEAAKQMWKELDIPVIFLTAYADESTINRAKHAEPFGYIIKPFKEIDLKTTVEIALHKYSLDSTVRKERDIYSAIISNATSDSVFIKSNSRQKRVKVEDILYVEALKDYVVVNTVTERYTIHSTMKDIQKKLPLKNFVRAHRSFIVNIDKIDVIEDSNLIIGQDKKVIPIGGSYKEDLMSRLSFI
ncbi:MAG: response regulator [Flavobacteriales bacterium]|nr:response regulator [Flavobacteriales bacterium]MCB9449610.1 response regulator [Flavobacteriales bacterium]